MLTYYSKYYLQMPDAEKIAVPAYFFYLIDKILIWQFVLNLILDLTLMMNLGDSFRVPSTGIVII